MSGSLVQSSDQIDTGGLDKFIFKTERSLILVEAYGSGANSSSRTLLGGLRRDPRLGGKQIVADAPVEKHPIPIVLASSILLFYQLVRAKLLYI
jgi:hypothetical protein